MDAKLKQIVTALCVLVISGLAAANCGSCSSGKEACPSNCKKACCSEPEKKACPADCQKACCTQAAPDFTLEDLGGKEVHLGKLKGKIVVLEWTNYDCPFVKAHYSDETKTAAKLIEKYAKKDVVWLTINSTHYATTETNREWAKKNGPDAERLLEINRNL